MVDATAIPLELLDTAENVSMIIDVKSIDKVIDDVNMNWPEYEHTPIWNDMQHQKGEVYWAHFTNPRPRKKAKKPTPDEVADILANIGEDADA